MATINCIECSASAYGGYVRCLSCLTRYRTNGECKRCATAIRANNKSGLCISCYRGDITTGFDRRAYDRAWKLALKQQVMDAYGGRCTCCGESNLIFLAIDHINGGGALERRRKGRNGGGSRIYMRLRREGWPEGFQVLCFNCNWAKANGGCPHQTQEDFSWLEPCCSLLQLAA